MSEDERITQNIKMLLEDNKKMFEETGTHLYFSKAVAEDVQDLLDLYKQEREKNKKLSEKLTEQICNKVEVEVLEEYRLKLKNSISKDKIRGKLKYATKMRDFYTINEPGHVLIPIYNEVIKVCKELLEEE